VEEILRYDPPVAYTIRVATAPLSVDGVAVSVGESITPCFLAAGHDPAVHAEPHRFDIERADTTHLAFGGGPHYCIGAALARAQAQIAIPLFLDRFPDMRLDPANRVERKRVPAFNGIEALWVRTSGPSETDRP
ncbi:MAG: cytochrome P450, partial [Hyphomicrobiales bacterium]|nr:cytochrome P450 [Hyphomicrobiales bacterium]